MEDFRNTRLHYGNNGGFTLVEIIAVLSILAVLATISIPKFIDLSIHTEQKILDSAINDLNSRELLEWTKTKVSEQGWIDDKTLFSKIDYNLGKDFHWSPKAKTKGGKLHFRNTMNKLERTPSTSNSAGKWKIIKSSNG